MVSIFEGLLSRTWHYTGDPDMVHTITLRHDTLSGHRVAFLDFQEIMQSEGHTSPLTASAAGRSPQAGHRIFFNIKTSPGYIEIVKKSWNKFEYHCYVSDVEIPEDMSVHKDSGVRETYDVDITDVVFTEEDGTGNHIAWYYLSVKRNSDNVATTVHRRFCEFAHLNSQLKQNLKGTPYIKSLPKFASKMPKFAVDHEEPKFVNNRKQRLSLYVSSLVNLPFVVDMTCTKAFLGLIDQVREVSFAFQDKLGLTLAANKKSDAMSPAVIQSIQQPDNCEGIYCGDCVSRVNGESLTGVTFSETISRITRLPRPIVIHFIQIVAAAASPSAGGSSSSSSSSSSSAGAGKSVSSPVSPSRRASNNNNTTTNTVSTASVDPV
jgi:hypothetical protein